MRIFFDYGEYNMGTITVNREITSVMDETAQGEKLSIYPSPTRDKLFVSGIDNGISYSILNVYGQVMQKGMLSENKTLDIQTLQTGIYFIRFEGRKGWQTEQFIKL